MTVDLPPAGAETFLDDADVTAEVCPLVDRLSLTELAGDVPDRVSPEGQNAGDLSPGRDEWTIFTPGGIMSCFDRSRFRAIGISLDAQTDECEATASIVPSCDL